MNTLGVITYNNSSPLPSGCIGWWKFENNYLDSSGNSNDLTEFSTPVFETGKIGQAILLNGSNGATRIDPFASFESTQAFSVSCWIRCTTTNKIIISKSLTTGSFRGWSIRAVSLKKPNLYLTNDYVTSVLQVRGNIALPLDWIHLVITYNGNKTASGIEFYLNKVLQAKTTVVSTLGNNTILNTGNFTVGGLDGVGSWDKNVDELMLFTKVLTQAEVTQIYNMS